MAAPFTGAGKAQGLALWRIEESQPVEIPVDTAGAFASGASYIILHTTLTGEGKSHQIHSWFGKDTNKDLELGTAKLVADLNKELGSKAEQHRQPQGEESVDFTKLFKGGVTYTEEASGSSSNQVESKASGPSTSENQKEEPGTGNAASTSAADSVSVQLRLFKVEQQTKRGGRILVTQTQASSTLKEQLSSRDIFVIIPADGSVWLWQGRAIVAKSRKTGKQLYDDVRAHLKLPSDTSIQDVKEGKEPESLKSLFKAVPSSSKLAESSSSANAPPVASADTKRNLEPEAAHQAAPSKSAPVNSGPAATAVPPTAAETPAEAAASPASAPQKLDSAAVNVAPGNGKTQPSAVDSQTPIEGKAETASESQGESSNTDKTATTKPAAETQSPATGGSGGPSAAQPVSSEPAASASGDTQKTAEDKSKSPKIANGPVGTSAAQKETAPSTAKSPATPAGRDPKENAQKASTPPETPATPSDDGRSVEAKSVTAQSPATPSNKIRPSSGESPVKSGQKEEDVAAQQAKEKKLVSNGRSPFMGNGIVSPPFFRPASKKPSRPSSASNQPPPDLTLQRKSSREELKEGLRSLEYKGHVKPSEANKYFGKGAAFVPAPQDYEPPPAAPKTAESFKLQPGKDTFPYSQLKGMRGEDGIDMTRKELYLSDEEFKEVFGKTKEEFQGLQRWRQIQAKKSKGLF